MIEVIETMAPTKYGFAAATVNPKTHRVSLNTDTINLLCTMSGLNEVTHVLVMRDTENANVMYLKPCEAETPNARTLSRTPKGKGRFFDARKAMERVGWKLSHSITIKAGKDKSGSMIVLDKRKVAKTLHFKDVK